MPPPGLGGLWAIYVLTSTSHTQHCSFWPKKHQSRCLCCSYLRKRKGKKLQSIPVFSQEMQSPPQAVRPHMCLVKGLFPRELRFEGEELHCLLADHGIAHRVCQDCSSPVGLAARDSHLRGTHTQGCSVHIHSTARVASCCLLVNILGRVKTKCDARAPSKGLRILWHGSP